MPSKFTVPQFIDSEDKIMGPLSVRQFIIIIVAILFMFLSWKLVSSAVIGGLLILFWGGLGLVFAFAKVNAQPFHVFLLNFLQTARRPTLRLWYKDYTPEEIKYYAELKAPEAVDKTPKRKVLQRSRLSQLSLMVNTGGAYNPEDFE